MLRDIERTVLYLRSGNCSACKKQITIFIFDGTIMTGCLICMSIKCQNFLKGVIPSPLTVCGQSCFSTDGQCHSYLLFALKLKIVGSYPQTVNDLICISKEGRIRY